MKKYFFILWAALTMTSVFTACMDNDSPMTEQTESKTVTIRATIDGDLGSRVTLTDDADNHVVKVDWAEGDNFKITVNETDYIFTYNIGSGEFECNNFPTTFTETETLNATYPATPPTEYVYQSGTLAGAAKLLTMKAEFDVTAGQSTDNLNLNFKHENSIVKMTLSNNDFKEKSVTWVTLKSGDAVVATATGSFTSNADGSIVAYFAVEPQSVTDVSILAVCEYKNYTATLTGNTLAKGTLYNVTKGMTETTPMGKITAATAVKGDLAMADGTFISKDDINDLTDEQKANVRGIVFWTEDEDGSATLESDDVMNADFPYCTHGLIVALTNVHEGCAWQNPYESVYTNFQNTDNFNPSNKSDYKFITSQYNGTDNINYILGYQNTKVLEAYNLYCSTTSGKENYKVNPVSELADWKESNRAPANTTGWFIPSVKELHMLCHKDDIYYGNSTETRDEIDPLIEALGGKKLSTYNYYWLSLESAGAYEGSAFIVNFDSGKVNRSSKDYGVNCVRAVCAY